VVYFIVINPDDKMLLGIGRMESSPILEDADVSNKMGVPIGSTGNINFQISWIYDVFAPFHAISQQVNLQSFVQDVEVNCSVMQTFIQEIPASKGKYLMDFAKQCVQWYSEGRGQHMIHPRMPLGVPFYPYYPPGNLLIKQKIFIYDLGPYHHPNPMPEQYMMPGIPPGSRGESYYMRHKTRPKGSHSRDRRRSHSRHRSRDRSRSRHRTHRRNSKSRSHSHHRRYRTSAHSNRHRGGFSDKPYEREKEKRENEVEGEKRDVRKDDSKHPNQNWNPAPDKMREVDAETIRI